MRIERDGSGWVLGSRNGCIRMQFVVVPKKTAKNPDAIVLRYVRPGSIIRTYSWRGSWFDLHECKSYSNHLIFQLFSEVKRCKSLINTLNLLIISNSATKLEQIKPLFER